MPRKGETRPAMDRFEEKVDRSGACHLWTGGRHHRDHYGHFWGGRVNEHGAPIMERAHRWLYEQHHGPIPDGLVVRHTCDEPLCVRLEHLVLGTHADNHHDMVQRGRVRYHTKLTAEQVAEIRALAGTMSQQAIGARYGVSQVMVSRIHRGRSW